MVRTTTGAVWGKAASVAGSIRSNGVLADPGGTLSRPTDGVSWGGNPFWGRFLIEVTRHPSVGHRMGDCVYPIPPRRIPMSCHPRVTEWTMTIQTHLPHLTKPQATVLALWSLGMVLARSCALTAVSAFLATWLGR